MTDNDHSENVPNEKCCKCPLPGCGCWVIAVVGLLLIVVMLFVPGVRSGPDPVREKCYDNLHKIALAMFNYDLKYHSLPPAYVTDSSGRPLHSWQVLLLPFLGKKDLYDKIRFDEPWDSPSNRSILKDSDASRLFHCPSDRNTKTDTSYVMVLGPNTISDGPHSVRFEDIKDSPENTIMVVELKDSGIHWAEPRDLDFKDMSFRNNDPNNKGIGSYHPGLAGVVFADGHMELLAEDIDPKILKALFTINGGEDVKEFRNW